MARKIMGKKRGMIQLFDETGATIACTVIEAEPNIVTQLKTKETDGYDAVQIGFEAVTAKDPRRKEQRTSKPMRGHFAKQGVEPRKYLTEIRVDGSTEHNLGDEISVETFSDVGYVDVTATSKGKGFQGLIKKKNFRGGPASHGSGFHRHAGSTGMRSTPGRCFAGSPRPSHMGSETVTVQNLQIVEVDAENHLIILKGAVPGATGDLVYVQEATKLNGANKTSGVKLWQS